MTKKMSKKEIKKSLKDIESWNKKGQVLMVRFIYSTLLEISDTLKEISKQLKERRNAAQTR